MKLPNNYPITNTKLVIKALLISSVICVSFAAIHFLILGGTKLFARINAEEYLPVEWLVFEEENYDTITAKDSSLKEVKRIYFTDIDSSLASYDAKTCRRKKAALESGDPVKYFSKHKRLALYPIRKTNSLIKKHSYEIQLIDGDANEPQLLGAMVSVNEEATTFAFEGKNKGTNQLITIEKKYGRYKYFRFIHDGKIYTALPLRMKTLSAKTFFYSDLIDERQLRA